MNKKLDRNDEEEEIIKPFSYYHQIVTRNIHHFYISSFLDEAHHFTEMIYKIQTAGDDDLIYLHLNTIGGYMASGIQIINALRTTPAHTIASLEGEVSSFGTMLFLAADEFVVHENSLLMFHNYSGGVWGKGHEQVAALESATKWTEDFMRRIYIPFMTEDEVERLIRGEDIYMHPPEILERLRKMSEPKEEEIEKKPPPKKRTPRKKSTPKKKTTS